MLFCLPATHIYAHFGDYGLRILHFNAVDSRKVHPGDSIQLPAKVIQRSAVPCSEIVVGPCGQVPISRASSTGRCNTI